ncbi:cAMP-activated global transcriptional regulator CRP [Lamprobacter modestohalophilus]|uniref:cAMP-activated global transcriptional regulator CRP n=1 Tax=Lamprobacter modestohalophilus TaxID=1064514 RepID=UPI002ADEAF66|nr:cAMP-activated global transcriptional regulator CRP [Lamprobacter modestohalophilus]MCF7976683.1 cAMP-activated global transcriptional regulator CRP [Chromatiaceae bacterium]MCF7994438.1 cAMP-activated global transcriptional regulator CRP [Chromatiaceae bacterium]MCF8003414.1 cAMP-activated global transcriptional regulator CRP [Chromatiaceae bacterium]MCF8014820.1 cAMP-activated global transcriptional regulator CRP [Chromatiaceae bacterium]MEA1052597.1 cAMP-activated global transcriptional 
MLSKPPQEPAWLKPFLIHCHTKHYDKHIDFIRRGEPAESLYYLIDGSVTALIEDDERHELTLAYINKGEFVGEMGLFQSLTSRSVIVRTREPCTIAEISYARMQQLLERELSEHALGLMFAIGGQLAQRLKQTSRQVGDLAFLDVTGRIAGALLELCKQPDAMTHPDGMQIKITRQDLGRMVGCSREMAGRVLKNLEEKGHISVAGKTIVVFGTR